MKVTQIPALKDNYIHVLQKENSQKVVVVDPSEAGGVHQFLKKQNLTLDYILNTHHHYDHVGGNLELKKYWNCQIVGFKKDAHRIPGIDILLEEDEIWKWDENLAAQAIFIPGHTLGHIAFWFSKQDLLFCGDTLFAMGCGRLFEGTPEQMLLSLKKLSKLPKKTQIYCGHEYTWHNGQFALQIEKHNLYLQKRMKEVSQKHMKKASTLPFTLSEELETNPFLRCQHLISHSSSHPAIQKWMKTCRNIHELDMFIQIRKLKDQF